MKYDLIIIGAGPGGYETAIAAAKAELHTLLIEGGSLGGTCLNEGCIPTKCLCRHAEVLDDVRKAGEYGISTGAVTFDLQQAVQRKNAVVAQLIEGVKTLLKSPFITILPGMAEFVDAHTVKVGEEVYAASNIFIATGSVAKMLPVTGVDCKGVVTAREMLDLTELPKRLCVIGGGVIGLEFASMFRSFGSEVSVVEYAKEVLPNFDKDIAKRLRTALKHKGISFQVGAAVNGIVPVETGYKVTYDAAGKSGEVEADLVLMSVGRAPRMKELNLEKAGINYTPRGIVVDENMETNVSGVFAIGDVNGLCPLAHAATAQGLCALNKVLKREAGPNLNVVPAAVFTVPEVAAVGLTEESAKASGVAYTVRKSFYRANGKALSMGASEGLVKLLADADDHIIGAHILGAHAADMIHELALAMHGNMKVADVERLIHAHPTLSEIVHAATM